ncbi:MAG: hypothetical protein K0R19_2072 [Bacillota bacterium]|jgi:hypothetical protein|nr:hypothetical protein [Bacillota bacterium]
MRKQSPFFYKIITKKQGHDLGLLGFCPTDENHGLIFIKEYSILLRRDRPSSEPQGGTFLLA